jgi:hypothetical protein
MSLRRRTSAIVVVVDESVAPMQDRHVVDEMQVPGLRSDLELRSARDGLEGIEGGVLRLREGRERRGARVRGGAEEGGGRVVDDEAGGVVVEDRAAVGCWAGPVLDGCRGGGGRGREDVQSEWPVRRGEGADDGRAGGGEDVVHGVGGGDDAFAA